MQAWRLGVNGQQAARQLAEAETHLKIMPDGKPFLETVLVDVSGLESLPASMRKEVAQRLRESLAHGKLGPIVLAPRQASIQPGRALLVAFLTVLFLGMIFLWAGFLR
jgi:hypothetical protein